MTLTTPSRADPMTPPRRSLLFLDTNVLLHFKPIQDIDWASLLAEESVDARDLHFVVARVTIRELDEQKTKHHSRTIRDRAARVAKEMEQAYLASRAGAPHLVRGAFPIIVQPLGDVVDFELHNLQRDSGDDHLIATMLSHRAREPETALILMSDDVGPRLTAEHHNVRAVRPRDADRLPSEEDAITKELKALRLENTGLRNKEPQLALTFETSALVEAPDRLAIRIPLVPEEPVEAWAGALAAASACVPVIPQPPIVHETVAVEAPKEQARDGVSRRFDLAQIKDSDFRSLKGYIEPKEYERYAQEITQYLAAYEQRLRGAWDLWNEHRRSFLVQLQLHNGGTIPAEDIEVRFYIPDGPDAELVSGFEMPYGVDAVGNVPYIPGPPSPPPPPRTALQIIMQPTNEVFTPQVPLFAHRGSPPPRGLVLRRTNSFEGDQQFERLKHGFTAPLAALRLWFPPTVEPRGFQIRYRITAANMATPKDGVLHIRIVSGD